MVIVDYFEKVYLAGFCFLHIFVTVFPIVNGQSDGVSTALNANSNLTESAVNSKADAQSPPKSAGAFEFLPLMATSVYCAIGLTWAFLRLSFIYMKSSSKP